MMIGQNILKGSHPKLVESVQQMLVDLKYKLPFYGEYNLMINFHENKQIPTCGVNVTRKGMNFYFNPDFLDNLSQKEVNFITLHEDFHLLFSHPKRTVTGRYNHELANIAQDMIINSCLWEEISHDFIEIPKEPETGRNMGLFLPKEYKGDPIFEELYEWLRERREENKKKFGSKQQGKCQTCDGTGKKQPDQNQQGQGGQQQGQQGQQDKDQQGQGQQQGDGQAQGQQQDQQQDSQGQQDQQQGQGQQNQDQQGQGGGQGQDQQGDGQGNGDGGHSHDPSAQEPCPDCGGSGREGDGPTPGGGGSGTPDKDCRGNDSYGDYGQGGIDTYSVDSVLDNLDRTKGQYMDVHIEDEVPEELRDAMVRDQIERLKARGFSNGNIEKVLDRLRKKRKDYLKEIKKSVSNIIFGDNKQRTISRPNRRGIHGLKGNRKIKSKINCILDTSGSMGGMFDKVLSYIYRNDIETNLIQCDTRVTKVETVKSKKKLEQVHIKGLGGTVLQPAVDVLAEDFNKYNTVILTDGYTDSLDFSKVKGRVLILSTGSECPISSKPKGQFKQIIIEDPR